MVSVSRIQTSRFSTKIQSIRILRGYRGIDRDITDCKKTKKWLKAENGGSRTVLRKGCQQGVEIERFKK
jgi:hypothetical protein